MIRLLLGLTLLIASQSAFAQNLKGLPALPTSGPGFRGSVGIGFTDIGVVSPSTDFKLDRGTFISAQIERGFDFAHLYLVLGLSYMDAAGSANYNYTNLSSSKNYTLNDVGFRAKSYELNLGLKLKLIDDYWFRPYVEGGGIGSYNDISYGGLSSLQATGTDYKTSDIIMGSGYYYEGGLEIQFSDRFGVRLAARRSTNDTKPLDTLNKRSLKLSSDTYYLSATMGL